MIHLKRILVPTDFSKTSEIAIDYARALAEAFDASVQFIYVVEEPYVHGWSGLGYIPDVPQFRETLRKNAQERLDKLLTSPERARFRAETFVKFGNPFVEIVRHAREAATDLIVMGTHGRGPVGHMLLGSVAEKVVRKA